MHRIQEFLLPELKQCTLLFHPFAPHFAAAAAFLQGFDCFDLRDLFNGIRAIPPIDQMIISYVQILKIQYFLHHVFWLI